MTPALLFLIGASGAGKTSVVKVLDARAIPGLWCYHFDSIGVPSAAIMERDFGTGENWQAVTTREWVDRLIANQDGASVALLEGQTRPSFLRPALERAGVQNSRIVLLDCHADVRAARLRGPRGQPELATSQMDEWAAYLREQASAVGLPIVDTNSQSLEAIADAIQVHLDSLRVDVPLPNSRCSRRAARGQGLLEHRARRSRLSGRR